MVIKLLDKLHLKIVRIAMLFQKKILSYVLFLIVLITSSSSFPHTSDPRGRQSLDWKTEQISQVFSFLPFRSPGFAGLENHGGKQCMVGSLLDIRVRDEYAYDIDETVTIDVVFDMSSTTTDEVVLRYDKNGGVVGIKKIQLVKKEGQRFYNHTLTLERARLSGRNNSWLIPGGDLSIGVPGINNHSITICDIVLKRSYETPKVAGYGRLVLKVIDEFGNLTPARVGIYDADGRAPLPQQDAVPVKYYDDIIRSVSVLNDRMSWPSTNPQAFYTRGSYAAKLPQGTYSVVVARGLEYRVVQQTFKIKAGEESPVIVELVRWTDMPAKGWYSGDVHIHAGRESTADGDGIRLHSQAEDINVTNLLQMGNVGNTYYRQNSWGKAGYYGEYPYALVSGQEDPRTVLLGHTIQLNIEKPIRKPKHYYLYHEVFEMARSQGGVVGYAHGAFNFPYGRCPGLALDLPFNLVDFVEVLNGSVLIDCWFDALNLGYKVSPAAGSDFPYGSFLGEARSYVDTGNQYSNQAWFDGLKSGRTFSTNGPVLEFTINGAGMGSEIGVDRGGLLVISAKASINPDVDLLESVELIKHGEVIDVELSKNGAEELTLSKRLTINSGSWFVIVARGKKEKIVAISAPIYVSSENSGFCKPSAIPSIVEKWKRQMRGVLVSSVEDENESWDSFLPGLSRWEENKDLLRKRINKAIKKYDNLVALSNIQRCVPTDSN